MNHDVIHTVFEAAAAAIGLVIGVVAMARRKYTLEGSASLRMVYWECFGFLSAILTGIHLAVSVFQCLSADAAFAGPATWFVSQAGFVALLYLVWNRPKKIKKSIGFLLGAILGGCLTVIFVKGVYYMPSRDFVSRPFELLLVLMVFPVVVSLYKRPRVQFQEWLLWAGIVFIIQQGVIAFSSDVFDAVFYAGHGLKIVVMLLAYKALMTFEPINDGLPS